MTIPQSHELPELPTPAGPWHATSDDEGYYTYTAEQLHAYGQSCIESALQSASAEGVVAWNERVLPSLRNRLMMRLRVHGMGETESAKVANEEVDFVETVLSAYFGKWPAKPEAQSGDWVMVPREPTHEMVEAGVMFGNSPNKAAIIYQNMIHAAPNPPLPRDFRSDGLERTSVAAPQPPAASVDSICETCNGHGMIGGPSYYQPDEGGEPCPDCAVTQQASVEDVEAQATDAMVDAYLAAQAKAVQEVDDKWGNGGKAASYLHPVREACRAGLTAALRTRSVGVDLEQFRRAVSEWLNLSATMGKAGHVHEAKRLLAIIDTARTVSRGESNG